MRLSIVTPLSVVVDEEMESLRAEDISGSFGILPGHAAFLTSLAISVVSWRTTQKKLRFCAVRGGVLTVSDGKSVAIASREAVPGDDLATLDQTVLARFRADLEVERTEHTESTMLQINAVRQLVSRLRPRVGLGSLG
ncbi:MULTISPECIES: F0F1 ATP synthase subunit epsilon [unclassified Rhizobium]|uniref:F0F1 ATP synthase subunit epsilon n=1 Tax=unclassified Rhizobium TaxID=2613769 RepID=UPI001AD9D476|nr:MULTISPECIES: F0F1 ATP synthase subunit epsilon [unclassified Rhizobium]MBO9099611.1 F0F1 ATP synthase subunit epsilon [Rhizobium sp. L58/93]QXZ86918.1 F0F1 ATP synthase subunit epsilon [Rhizobium sp. K1/93]QXZ93048.1 F0F1 ATP synthase subunit epsilon [Rhizobium sp. K15/93]